MSKLEENKKAISFLKKTVGTRTRVSMKEITKKVKASRERQKLETLNWRIWRKHNWSHRGDVDNNWSTFKDEVKAGLKSAGISRVAPEVLRELEDDNLHALIQALIEIGVAPRNY
jgi:hypothetical protein